MKDYIINNGTKEIFSGENSFETCFSYIINEMGCQSGISCEKLSSFCQEFDDLCMFMVEDGCYFYETYYEDLTSYNELLSRLNGVTTVSVDIPKIKIAFGVSMLLWAYYGLSYSERNKTVIFGIPDSDISLLFSAKVLINSSFNVKFIFGNNIDCKELLFGGELKINSNDEYNGLVKDFFDVTEKRVEKDFTVYQIGNFDRVKFNNYVISKNSVEDSAMNSLCEFFDEYEYLTDVTTAFTVDKLNLYRKTTKNYDEVAIILSTRSPYLDVEEIYTMLTDEDVKNYTDAVEKLYNLTAIPKPNLTGKND